MAVCACAVHLLRHTVKVLAGRKRRITVFRGIRNTLEWGGIANIPSFDFDMGEVTGRSALEPAVPGARPSLPMANIQGHGTCAHWSVENYLRSNRAHSVCEY
jgi:hypothetical protein